MTKLLKIAFVGSHGVGKTTLLEKLREYEDINKMFASTHYVEETAAKVFEMGKTNPALVINQGATLEAQLHIIGLQMQDEDKQLGSMPNVSNDQPLLSLMICDRTILDAVVYTYSRIFSDGTYPWAKDLPDNLYNWVCKSNRHPYDIVFYLPISFPLQTTEIRPGDLEFQERIDDLMQGVFIQHMLGRTPLNNFDSICKKVVVLSGPIEDRVTRVVRHIKTAVTNIKEKWRYD